MKVHYVIYAENKIPGQIRGAHKEFEVSCVPVPPVKVAFATHMAGREDGSEEMTSFDVDVERSEIIQDPEDDSYEVILIPSAYYVGKSGKWGPQSYENFCSDMKFLAERKGWELIEDPELPMTIRKRRFQLLKGKRRTEPEPPESKPPE